LLLSIWYDLSDVKLAEALDDRASFRRFCGFAKPQVAGGNAGRAGRFEIVEESDDERHVEIAELEPRRRNT
ncbi:transposase, partial [Novosphingobium sp. M1R2S20]